MITLINKFTSKPKSYITGNQLSNWMRNISRIDTGFRKTKFGLLHIKKKYLVPYCVKCHKPISIKTKETEGFRLSTQFCHSHSDDNCPGKNTQNLYELTRKSEIPEDTTGIDPLDHKEDLDAYDILKDSQFRSLLDHKTSITFEDLNEESKIILKRLCFDDEIATYIQRVNKIISSGSLSRVEKFMNDQLIEMSCRNKMQLTSKPAMIQALILIGLLSKETRIKIKTDERYPNMLCYAKPDDQIIHNCIYIFFSGIAGEMKFIKSNACDGDLLCYLYLKCGRSINEFDRSDQHFQNILKRTNPKECTSKGKGLCVEKCNESFHRFRRGKLLSAPTGDDKAAESKFHEQLKSDHRGLYPTNNFRLGDPIKRPGKKSSEENNLKSSNEIFRVPITIPIRSNQLPNDHPLKAFEKDILDIVKSDNMYQTFEEKFKNETFHDGFLEFAQVTINSDKPIMWYLYSSSLSEHGDFKIFNIRQTGDMSNITKKRRLKLHKKKITSLEKTIKDKNKQLKEKTQQLEEKDQQLEEKDQQVDSLYSDLETALFHRDTLISEIKKWVPDSTAKQILEKVYLKKELYKYSKQSDAPNTVIDDLIGNDIEAFENTDSEENTVEYTTLEDLTKCYTKNIISSSLHGLLASKSMSRLKNTVERLEFDYYYNEDLNKYYGEIKPIYEYVLSR